MYIYLSPNNGVPISYMDPPCMLNNILIFNLKVLCTLAMEETDIGTLATEEVVKPMLFMWIQIWCVPRIDVPLIQTNRSQFPIFKIPDKLTFGLNKKDVLQTLMFVIMADTWDKWHNLMGEWYSLPPYGVSNRIAKR